MMQVSYVNVRLHRRIYVFCRTVCLPLDLFSRFRFACIESECPNLWRMIRIALKRYLQKFKRNHLKMSETIVQSAGDVSNES